MEINSINNLSFGARIKIEKTNLTNFAKKVSNYDNLTDASLISTSIGSTVSGTVSEIGASGSGLHVSAQIPQCKFVPSFFAHSLPDSAWNFLQRFVNPLLGIKEHSIISAYSSSLGAFMQKFGKSGMDFCEFTPKGKRSFPS